jgi:hypothetical protein
MIEWKIFQGNVERIEIRKKSVRVHKKESDYGRMSSDWPLIKLESSPYGLIDIYKKIYSGTEFVFTDEEKFIKHIRKGTESYYAPVFEDDFLELTPEGNLINA